MPNAEGKKPWGASSGARSYYRERNAQIRQKHRQGSAIEQLAEEFSLSTDSIRKILY